ncbi:hypothetical protein D3C84_1010310 [compost metagenome]
MQCPGLKAIVQRFAQITEAYGRPDISITEDRHPGATPAFDQQRIAAVLVTLAVNIHNDPPALAPVAVDGMNHDSLAACDRFAPGAAQASDQRICRLLAMVRLGQCR